jgi:hypothetical protein
LRTTAGAKIRVEEAGRRIRAKPLAKFCTGSFFGRDDGETKLAECVAIFTITITEGVRLLALSLGLA